MKYGIFIHGLPNGQPTDVDGKWLSFYNPKAHRGRGEIRATIDPDKALSFTDRADAIKLWTTAWGTRMDGRPNKPLTAYTVSIEPLP